MAFAFDLMENACNNNIHKSEIFNNILAWRALMSRAHYNVAKTGNYTQLFSFIQDKYKITSLKKPVRNDSSAYKKLENIGQNFESIDAMLTLAYHERPKEIIYEKRCRYISRIVDYIRNTTEESTPLTQRLTIPKREISLYYKFFYSPFVYKTSLLFFKKGSKARNFFKKLLIPKR